MNLTIPSQPAVYRLESPDGGIVPPPIQPLDLGRMDGDDVLVELERTVEDMKVWLACVELGMDELLGTELGVDG